MKKTRISKKKLQSFIDSIANVVDTDKEGLEDALQSYVSKVDGSYLTFVGLEENLKFLLRKGITEQVTNLLGFNPVEQKWYGRSHRAIFGFGIGSTCKKDNSGYRPSNKEDYIESCRVFYGDLDMEKTGKDKVTATETIQDGTTGVSVAWIYKKDHPNEKLRGTIGTAFSPYPKTWGKGEWTATTLEEAKEMALDFAESVS